MSVSFSKNLDLLKTKYYKGGDLAGSYFLKEAIDHIESIRKCIVDFNSPVISIIDLYRFLWCKSFSEMIGEINLFKIDELVKTELININNLIKLDKGSVVQFINNNYKEIFDKTKHEKIAWYDFFDRILDIIFNEFSKSISKDVFCFLEEEFPLNLLSKFEICEKYYKKNEKQIAKLFNGIRDTRVFDDQVYLRFLCSVSNGKSVALFKDNAEFITKRTLDYIKAKPLNDDSNEIIEIQNLLKDYRKLARLYETSTANEYDVLIKKVSKLLDSFIKKHGQHFKSGPYDLMPAIEMLKTNKDPLKFIWITHNGGKDNSGENVLNYIFNIDNQKNPLSEIFNDIGRNRSEKYPYFKQDSMQLNFWLRNRLINLIMIDESLSKEYANYIYNISLLVEKEYFDNFINIERETTGLFDVFLNLINLAKQEQFETPYAKSIMYGSCLHICSIIEKILRNVAYKELKDQIYFDQNKVSLASLFKVPVCLNDISDGLKYHLEFYLIKEANFIGLDDDRPGLNIRNKLMHDENEVFEETKYETFLTLIYLLSSLLGDLFIKSRKD